MNNVTVLTLIAFNGCEFLKIGDQQIQAEIGQSIVGRTMVTYQSGWLKAAPGLGFITNAPSPESLIRLKTPMEIEISGLDGKFALIARKVDEWITTYFPIQQEAFSIGRSSKNEIVCRDSIVSACHGRFCTNGDGQLMYADLSKNGTYLNGSFLAKKNETLKLDDTLFIPPFCTIRLTNQGLAITMPKNAAWEE